MGIMTRTRAVSVAAVAVLWLLSAQYAVSAEPVRAGTVSAVRGGATVSRGAPGAGETSGLESGQPVYVGDLIRTSERSRVKMLMVDDTILTLGSGAELVIREYDYSPDDDRRSSVVGLNSGNLRSLISRRCEGTGSKFEVHTMTAVAGARGTTNIISVIDPSMTLVVGTDGVTEARNADPSVEGEVSVSSGYGTYVEEGKPPTEPFLVPDSLLEPLERDTYVSRPPVGMPDDNSGPDTGLETPPSITTPVAPEPPADGIQEEPGYEGNQQGGGMDYY